MITGCGTAVAFGSTERNKGVLGVFMFPCILRLVHSGSLLTRRASNARCVCEIAKSQALLSLPVRTGPSCSTHILDRSSSFAQCPHASHAESTPLFFCDGERCFLSLYCSMFGVYHGKLVYCLVLSLPLFFASFAGLSNRKRLVGLYDFAKQKLTLCLARYFI